MSDLYSKLFAQKFPDYPGDARVIACFCYKIKHLHLVAVIQPYQVVSGWMLNSWLSLVGLVASETYYSVY